MKHPIFIWLKAENSSHQVDVKYLSFEHFSSARKSEIRSVFKRFKAAGFIAGEVEVRTVFSSDLSGDLAERLRTEIRVFLSEHSVRKSFFKHLPVKCTKIELCLSGNSIKIVDSVKEVKGSSKPQENRAMDIATPEPPEELPVKVLIVDDSRTGRALIKMCLVNNPDFEVIGEAENPLVAEELLKTIKPSVILLDVHMPKMNGLEFLSKFFPVRPIPTVMISGIAPEDGEIALKCLDIGAFHFLTKPDAKQLSSFGPHLQSVLKAAASTRPKVASKSVNTDEPVRMSSRKIMQNKIIAIGSSTGGTVALTKILSMLPEQIPPILIVQHIPDHFSKLFAKRLNDLNPFEVKIAEHGDELCSGRVLIAPGHSHMELGSYLVNGESRFNIKLNQEPAERNHRPAVNVLFRSIAKCAGKHTTAIILTGMGKDGAEGLLELKKAKSKTFAQDEQSSVVFGMPKAAFEIGATDICVALDDIAKVLMDTVVSKNS